jgi:hypothetical protein
MGQTAEAAYVFFLCVDEQPTRITDTKALLLWREGGDDFLEARISSRASALRTAHATAIRSIAEGDFDVTSGLHHLAVGWDES